MEERYTKNKYIKQIPLFYLCSIGFVLLICQGCGIFSGYSSESIYPDDVKTVCLKMFDNQTFRRGVEYELSDALAKRIEAETPYKIVSSQDYADTVISGQIKYIGEFVLTTERQSGHVLEKEVELRAVVNWKNLKTGELLIENRTINASASYSEYQQQDFKYGSNLAANNLAQNIVELMEKKW
ncbi:MAG: hypothetical protein JW787_06015 [Sedimentisphaerales bacterium]|nr:hypothetical protein [Sedimentisphaerales bacterium]